MGEVKRYEATTEWGNPVMSEYSFGGWVEYEDYITLKAERDALAAAHSELRESMAAIHNTIRLDGVNTSLGSLLSASKRAHEASLPTDAYANQLRAEGAASVGTLIRACVHEFPDSAEDIVEECAMIADNRAINLCKENGNG